MSSTGQRTRVLIVSHDVVGKHMAGPGIRYYHLARVLSREFDVCLAFPDKSTGDLPEQLFELARYPEGNWEAVEPLARRAEVVLIPGGLGQWFAPAAELGVPLVVDGYDPILAETMALGHYQAAAAREANWRWQMQVLAYKYKAGDFFICASERQRHWWLGLLEAYGRVNPLTFEQDPTLRALIDVVPFGLPEQPARHTRQVVKGVWPGIKPDDYVLLWGGGLWPWLDPLTAIRAVGRIVPHQPRVRLVFPGTRHPNPDVAGISTHAEAARALAMELGLLDRVVFFGDWVPYEDWPNVLLESDLALTLHFDTLETRLAFRSRVLEYTWAGLPIIATHGDATSEMIEHYGLGQLVGYADVEGVARAILDLREMPKTTFEQSLAAAQAHLTWERAAQPLISFCRHPRLAPDKAWLRDQWEPAFSPAESERLSSQAQAREKDAAPLRQPGAQLENEAMHLPTEVKIYEKGRIARALRWLSQRATRP